MKNNVVYKIYPKKSIKRIDSKVKLLGSNSNISTSDFLNSRLIFIILIFILTLIFSKYGYILALIFSVSFYFLYEKLVIDYNIAKRAKKLEKEVLFFFEVLTLTLESGRNLRQAISLTTLNIDSEISEEFKKSLAEVKLGKSLNEALEDMKKRIPSDVINNAILNMVQSNTYGTNIIDSMYTQMDYLREKQLLDVKAEIAKLPTKVSVISVLFFVPIMMLIILAPVLINYLTK